MQRRNFVKSVLGTVSAFFAVRRARAEEVTLEQYRELASVVLPSSMGRERTDKIAGDFQRWIGNYKAGAQISSGYGHPKTLVTGPNPSAHYAEQMRALGSPITRDAVAKAIEEAKVTRIPQHPDGKHIGSDLVAFFYSSSAGEDFLYRAAIRRDDCRGLADSGERPERLS